MATQKPDKKIDKKKSVDKVPKAGSALKSVSEVKKSVNEVLAKLSYVKVAPTKVRLVLEHLKNKPAQEALDYLRFINKAAVKPLTKLIKSAVANAEHNFNLDIKDLYIKSAIANDGPILHRYQPRAFGRSTPIRKRTSHIHLVLGVRLGAEPTSTKKVDSEVKVAKAQPVKSQSTKVQAKSQDIKVLRPEEVKRESLKISGQEQEQKGKDQKGFLRKIFSRKTG